MSKIRVRDLNRLVPDIDALRPLRRALVRSSVPDPADRWSRSGELSTAADRIVDLAGLGDRVDAAMTESRHHAETLARLVGEALERAAAGDPEESVHAYLDAMGLEAREEQHEGALALARAALSQAEVSRDPALEALALRRLGRAHRALGQVEEALQRYGGAWAITRLTPALRASAEAAIGAGNALEQAGRWAEAERWYHRALEALESADGPLPERWHVALNLHIVRRTLGDVDGSRAWLDQAEAEARRLADSGAEVLLDNARGQLHMAEDRHAEAADCFLSALVRSPRPYASVTIRTNLSETLLARGQLLDAAEEARAAEAEAIAHDVPLTLPHVYRTLGRCAAAMGNEDAFVLFERALEFQGPGGSGGLESAMTLQVYAETEAGFGRLDRAVDLLAAAGQTYLGLGVEQYRRRFVDCFDAGSVRSTSPQDFLSRLNETSS